MRMLATIKSFLERCALEKMSGELVLRVGFNQGGIDGMKVERTENVNIQKICRESP